ncbi:hypothetical protein BLN97_17575 [Bradyrhizobium elkanii]|nr:hypothetical protein BLN97_17575 [Bradyrhizobium elkanii]
MSRLAPPPILSLPSPAMIAAGNPAPVRGIVEVVPIRPEAEPPNPILDQRRADPRHLCRLSANIERLAIRRMIEAYFTKLREIGLRKRCFVLRRCAAEQFRIPEEGLSGPDQTAPIVRFRQITMAVARRLTGMSLPQIGQAFGGRDHTTVLHASRKYCGLVEDVLAEMYDGQSCPVEVEQ